MTAVWPTLRQRSGLLPLRRVVLGLVGAGAILGSPGLGWGATVAVESAPSAEVTYETPRRFATIYDATTTRRRLYGVGDILPDMTGSGGEYQITQIEEQKLQLSSRRDRKTVWIAVGDAIPGRPDRRVLGTPVLRMVEYRYVRTSGRLDPEPRVLALEADRARLEVDIPPTSASTGAGTTAQTPSVTAPLSPEAERKLADTLLGRVRVKPTGDDSYEISAADLTAVREQGSRLVAEVWPRVWPSRSLRDGVNLDIQSPIADGTLGPRGFRVSSPNLAERGGLQIGDLIVAVNGQPVNGFADVYRMYSQMRRDGNLSLIQLDVVREGQRRTKTYRIR